MIRSREDFSDPELGMVTDFSSASTSLLVAFGGMAGAMAGVPPLEFFRIAGRVDTKRMFIRDHHQSWYHRGVRGLGEDVPSVAAALRDTLAASATTHRVFVGNSAGSFGALLFGWLLEVDHVHAFAPRTALDESCPPTMIPYSRDALVNLIASGKFDRRYADLGDLFSTGTNVTTQFVIHLAEDAPLDVEHARRLEPFDRVEIRWWPSGGHALIQKLREDGSLAELLENLFRNPTSGR